MNLEVQSESATSAEAVRVLMDRLPASKVARLLSAWQIGQGDYLKLREELFAGETVEDLCRAAECVAIPFLPADLKLTDQQLEAVARRELTHRNPRWGLGDGLELSI